MRVANLGGRLVIVASDGHHALDVCEASSGHFTADPSQVYQHWADFAAWASTVNMSAATPFAASDLWAPAPAPAQVFAIGLNYRAHATEAHFAVPDEPTVMFTKWPSCLTGPVTTVELPPGGHTDWEVELVVVMSRLAYRVAEDQAWDHVAGVTVGQDLSERITQASGPSPQFSVAKSFPGFGPTGPWLVTPDELHSPDDLELGCSVNGEQVQKARTTDMVFPIPTLISWLSYRIPLLPGDVLFTGTPAGVGMGRTPPRYLQSGDELVSYTTGIGELRQRFVAASTE